MRPVCVTRVSERPAANPVARLQAQTGHKVTNMRHERVQVDEIDCKLLPLLDGSRDHAALLESLKEWAEAGAIELEKEGKPVEDAGETGQLLANLLDSKLQQLANGALLAG